METEQKMGKMIYDSAPDPCVPPDETENSEEEQNDKSSSFPSHSSPQLHIFPPHTTESAKKTKGNISLVFNKVKFINFYYQK